MVAELGEPRRPLRKRGEAWTWRPRPRTPVPWTWCRIYHLHPTESPVAETHRPFGPLFRLDHHCDQHPPGLCPEGREVLYVADTLETAIGEVFGDTPEDARVCPGMRVSLLEPTRAIPVLDLRRRGTAMRIGALPSLATGAYPRQRTQRWARAIFEDQPVPKRRIRGVLYTAAHAGGAALALWNTGGDVATVTGAGGVRQDFAIQDPALWTRVLVAANNLEVTMNRVAASDCPRCP